MSKESNDFILKPLKSGFFFKRKYVNLALLIFALFSCESKNTDDLKCVKGRKVGIQFTRPFSYGHGDSLLIDGLVYTHVGYLDSLDLGNYLPDRNPVIIEINGKKAHEDSNEISLGRALARSLKKSGNYTILNGPELLTTGRLMISRTDGGEIQVCIPEMYNATLYLDGN